VSDLTVHADVEVRFRDSDAMGHVNNAVYLTYPRSVAKRTGNAWIRNAYDAVEALEGPLPVNALEDR